MSVDALSRRPRPPPPRPTGGRARREPAEPRPRPPLGGGQVRQQVAPRIRACASGCQEAEHGVRAAHPLLRKASFRWSAVPGRATGAPARSATRRGRVLFAHACSRPCAGCSPPQAARNVLREIPSNGSRDTRAACRGRRGVCGQTGLRRSRRLGRERAVAPRERRAPAPRSRAGPRRRDGLVRRAPPARWATTASRTGVRGGRARAGLDEVRLEADGGLPAGDQEGRPLRTPRALSRYEPATLVPARTPVP